MTVRLLRGDHTCVLYVSFRSKVRPRTVRCHAMGSAVLFVLRSRLLLYSAGSGVNRVQVVLPGFSVRLFCFVQAKTLLASLDVVCAKLNDFIWNPDL